MPSASPSLAPRLDLGAALRQTVQCFWDDFAPIILLGFLLLTLPSLLLHATATPAAEVDAAGTTAETVIETFVALLAMLYVSAVNYGVMCTLAGRPLDTGTFIWAGLRAARPGLLVALVLGSLLMGALILVILFGRGSAVGWLFAVGIGVAIVLALVTWIVAIPAAIAERRMPWDALRRSAALTVGNRGRLIGFVGAVVLGLLPGIMLVKLFGPDASFVPVAEGGDLFSPAMWIEQLFWLLAQGLLATAPAVIYAQLARPR
jgi:hypothetical protein